MNASNLIKDFEREGRRWVCDGLRAGARQLHSTAALLDALSTKFAPAEPAAEQQTESAQGNGN
ncbi:MAG: hypothetical protein H6707_02450 [Deltaproteobacteria bacterium]|nr:hypothetical protein [Deltaproteobacteria bacterium]